MCICATWPPKISSFKSKLSAALLPPSCPGSQAEFVASAPANVAASITPQHMLLNRNALFSKGLRPHNYCLPILKRERHRESSG